jgi:putative transposase
MRFVDEHSHRFAVALLLRVLNVAESTYYQWVKQTEQRCDRDLVDLGLISNIHEIWEASGRTYGQRAGLRGWSRAGWRSRTYGDWSHYRRRQQARACHYRKRPEPP